jgi:hypothetical protein
MFPPLLRSLAVVADQLLLRHSDWKLKRNDFSYHLRLLFARYRRAQSVAMILIIKPNRWQYPPLASTCQDCSGRPTLLTARRHTHIQNNSLLVFTDPAESSRLNPHD